MVDWFKIREPLFPEFEEEVTIPNPFYITLIKDEEDQYMHFILEYADSTLFEMRDKLDLLQFKSVLFQILYALYIAQTELEFNHNDLHLKNILLKWTPNVLSHCRSLLTITRENTLNSKITMVLVGTQTPTLSKYATLA